MAQGDIANILVFAFMSLRLLAFTRRPYGSLSTQPYPGCGQRNQGGAAASQIDLNILSSVG